MSWATLKPPFLYRGWKQCAWAVWYPLSFFSLGSFGGLHSNRGVLSIQHKFRFEISEILRAQWNGTFRLHRPNPSHRAFGYCSFKQDTKERYWRQQFCEMKRDVSVWPTEMTGPVTGHRFTGGPKHSGQTDPKLIRFIWFLMEIRLLNWMESACDHLENFQRGSRHHNTGIPGNRAGSVVM